MPARKATPAETPIAELPNLGPRMTQWLAAIGVRTRADLAALGPEQAWRRLHAAGFAPSLNAAYALAGALLGVHWARLPADERSRLVLAIDALRAASAAPARCPWCGDDPDYVAYHDREWGVPVRDERVLFEFLILEGAQAGLSWLTILRKRDNYRRAFDGFDPVRIARYGERDVQRLLADPGIVRNRLKIAAAIGNARAALEFRRTEGSLSAFLWQFVADAPIQNAWTDMAQVPARTPRSDAMSKALAKRGFKFVGSTICYAFMQATGMVNDHLVGCHRHEALLKPTG